MYFTVILLTIVTPFCCYGYSRGKNIGKGYTNSALLKDDICRDRLSTNQCQYYKRYGGCKTHASRMKKICARTCSFCVTRKTSRGCKDSTYGCCNDGLTPALGPNFQGCQDGCTDEYGQAFCKTIERLGGCHGGQSDIGKRCMKTCRMCRTCKDKHFAKCQTWKRFYGCSSSLVRMNNHCRKTCGYCGKKDPCFGHSCPEHHHCKLNKLMKPHCVCDFHCREDDNRTGILCGRDGNEYKNLCDLRRQSCRLRKPIAVKKYGPCKEPVYVRTCSESFKEHDRCKLWVQHQACRTHKKLLSKWCPRSCGFCKAAYDPYSTPCYNTRYGCCPNRRTPCSTPGCENCPGKNTCKDRTKTLCKRFTHACGMDRNKSVMKMLCTETCQYCVRKVYIDE